MCICRGVKRGSIFVFRFDRLSDKRLQLYANIVRRVISLRIESGAIGADAIASIVCSGIAVFRFFPRYRSRGREEEYVATNIDVDDDSTLDASIAIHVDRRPTRFSMVAILRSVDAFDTPILFTFSLSCDTVTYVTVSLIKSQ